MRDTQAAAELKVLLASPRGFCAGVRRAIAIVERLLERHGPPVYVRHEIVHNRQVVNRLRALGAVFVDELAEIPDHAVTVFSAHGVARSVEAEAAARGLPVFDATCPLVTKVHLHGRRFAGAGRAIVMIGHAGHAEVEGTVGQIDAPVHLVSTAAEVAALPLASDTPIAYVTQTTLSIDDTRAVIAALAARFADVVGPEVADICYATQNRQSAVRDLARASELVIVVGAANSSNSNRLRELAAECGARAYLVDDADGLDPAWLDGVATAGITAGASAPEELVEGVVERLARLRRVTVAQLPGIEETVAFSLPRGLREAPAALAANR